MERRKRRKFDPEFRAEAVRLVREGTKSLHRRRRHSSLGYVSPAEFERTAEVQRQSA